MPKTPLPRLSVLVMVAALAVACDLPSPPPPPAVTVLVSLEEEPAVGALVSLERPGRTSLEPLTAEFGYWGGSTDSLGVFAATLRDTAQVILTITALPTRMGPCYPADTAFERNDRGFWARTHAPARGADTIRVQFRCPLAALNLAADSIFAAAAGELAPQALHGPVVVFANGRIDVELTERLPAPLRARFADSVRTFAVVTSSSERVGYYVGGGEALSSHFVVTMLDAASRTPRARESFVEGPPSTIDSRMVGAHGARPDGEIVKYVVRALEAHQPKR